MSTGVVYYVANHDCSLVKIGYSSNLAQRLTSLASAHGEVALLACESGSLALEHDRHRTFAANHFEGEWFIPADDLLRFVRALPSMVDSSRAEPPLTLRISPQAETLRTALAVKLGVNKSAVIEMAIRQMAAREKVK